MLVQSPDRVQLQSNHSPHFETNDSYLEQPRWEQVTANGAWLPQGRWVPLVSGALPGTGGGAGEELMAGRMDNGRWIGHGWVSWLCPPLAL